MFYDVKIVKGEPKLVFDISDWLLNPRFKQLVEKGGAIYLFYLAAFYAYGSPFKDVEKAKKEKVIREAAEKFAQLEGNSSFITHTKIEEKLIGSTFFKEAKDEFIKLRFDPKKETREVKANLLKEAQAAVQTVGLLVKSDDKSYLDEDAVDAVLKTNKLMTDLTNEIEELDASIVSTKVGKLKGKIKGTEFLRADSIDV